MRAVAILSILVGLIWLVGCRWSANVVSSEDSELARETLVAALDAWKSGEAQALAKRTPPIRFSDDDYLGGMSLIEYEIEQPEVPIAPFQNVRVELVLRDRHGRTLRKPTMYQVGIEPNLTVLRSDN